MNILKNECPRQFYSINYIDMDLNRLKIIKKQCKKTYILEIS